MQNKSITFLFLFSLISSQASLASVPPHFSVQSLLHETSALASFLSAAFRVIYSKQESSETQPSTSVNTQTNPESVSIYQVAQTSPQVEAGRRVVVIPNRLSTWDAIKGHMKNVYGESYADDSKEPEIKSVNDLPTPKSSAIAKAIDAAKSKSTNQKIQGNYECLDEKIKKASEEGKDLIEALPTGGRRVHLKTMVTCLLKGTARAFNPSRSPCGLMAVRVVFVKGGDDRFDAPTIKPGNGLESQYEHGENFWWINWKSDQFAGGTLFFREREGKLELMVPLEQKDCDLLYGADIRLFATDIGTFAFTSTKPVLLSYIQIASHEKYGARYFTAIPLIKNACSGVNYGIIRGDHKSCEYVDWFYSGDQKGLKIVTVKEDGTKTENWLRIADEVAFDGKGSCLNDQHTHRHAGVLPLLSFGTPHFSLELDGRLFQLGVGHAKIRVDSTRFPYRDGSNIQTFRAELGQMKLALGDKFIRHDAYNSQSDFAQGFHYLMYFYLIEEDQNGQAIGMRISNAVLPIPPDVNKAEYVFSVNFPMSITEKDGKFEILFGYGDWSANSITLDPMEVIELCQHDVKDIDFNDYEYYFMFFDGEENAILSQTFKH